MLCEQASPGAWIHWLSGRPVDISTRTIPAEGFTSGLSGGRLHG